MGCGHTPFLECGVYDLPVWYVWYAVALAVVLGVYGAFAVSIALDQLYRYWRDRRRAR